MLASLFVCVARARTMSVFCPICGVRVGCLNMSFVNDLYTFWYICLTFVTKSVPFWNGQYRRCVLHRGHVNWLDLPGFVYLHWHFTLQHSLHVPVVF